LIAIGVALPSAPGFFGIFELFAKAGLTIYGVREDLAVAWAISFHFLSFIPITLIGAWYFVRLGLHMREIGAATPR
jgi:glycosyltransferase 2 family protein